MADDHRNKGQRKVVASILKRRGSSIAYYPTISTLTKTSPLATSNLARGALPYMRL